MRVRLGDLAGIIVQRSGLILTLALLLTAALASQARHIRVRVDRDAAFPQGHRLVQIDRVIRSEFGGRNFVIIAVVPRHGDVWQRPVLDIVRSVTMEVMDLPHAIRKDTVSLASPNARVVTVTRERVVEDYLMRDVPADAAAMAALEERYRSNPLYHGSVVADDEGAAFVLADFWPEARAEDIAAAIADIVARYTGEAVDLYATGEPILLAAERRYMTHLPVFFAAAVVVIATALYVSFRSVQGMLLPLMTGMLSTVWGLGFMALADVPISSWNQGVPMLVLIVGAGHSSQVLKRYFEELRSTGDNTRSVVRSLARVAPAMIAAGGTAALGFASLALLGMPGMRDLGLSAAMGIGSAVVLELTFMPALRARLRPGPISSEDGARHRVDLVGRLAHAVCMPRGRAAILGIACLAAILAAGSLSGLDTGSGEPSDYLPDDDEATRHFHRIQERFPGTVTMTSLFEGPPGMAKEPDVLRAMDGLAAVLSQDPNVIRTRSLADVVKYLHQVFADAEFVLPEDRSLIAQLMFLGSGPAFERFVDRSYERAVVWTYLRSAAPGDVKPVLLRAQRFVDGLDLAGVDVKLAGGRGPMTLALHEHVTRGKLLSMAVLLCVSWCIASVVLGSPVAGLFVVLPLILSLLVSFGVLAGTGLPFDVVTASVLTIAVAIGADYAIYVLYRVREELQSTAQLEAAIRRALVTSGRAVVFVAVAISLGFACFTPSPFLAIRLSGLLTPVTMAASCLGAVTVMPALLLTLRPRFVTAGSRGRVAETRGLQGVSFRSAVPRRPSRGSELTSLQDP